MVTWDLVDEPWDALGTWTKMGSGTSEISPAGQLHQKPDVFNVGRQKTLGGGLPTQYTFEGKLKIDDFVTGGLHKYTFYDGEHNVGIYILPDRIRMMDNDMNPVDIFISTETGSFYTWRFVVDSVNDLVRVYRDSLYVGVFSNLYDFETNDGKIVTEEQYLCESHEDYFKLASGLFPFASPSIYNKITQKIIDVLKADGILGTNIKRWYFGEHDIRKPSTVYPFVDVKWRGGPVKKIRTGTVITRRQIDYVIRCVARHVDEETAEKFVMDNTEQIEIVLDINETLDGLVETSSVIEVLSDSIPIGGFSVVGSLTRLRPKT